MFHVEPNTPSGSETKDYLVTGESFEVHLDTVSQIHKQSSSFSRKIGTIMLQKNTSLTEIKARVDGLSLCFCSAHYA